MKFNYKLFGTFLTLLILLGLNNKVNAQTGDTLVVEWSADGGQTVDVNALRDAIANDTERPEGRVYKLRKGGYYWLADRIENNGFHLRIVGEDPGPTDVENPAVIQMTPRDDGSVDGRILTGLGDVTLKNLWITGITTTGSQGSYQPVQMDASNARFVIDNCIFDRSNFAMLAWTNTNNDITITNCKFRNLIGEPSTQQWEGRAISIWANQDSVILENNTFFNIGMTVLQIESGSANYVLFNHNTIVNLGRSINTGNWFQEAYFANNLVVNGYWHGEGYTDYSNPGRDPRSFHGGLFTLGDLPASYGPEQGRRVLFVKNSAWVAPEFTAYYADTIRVPQFTDPVSMLDHFMVYDNQIIRDTIWADPGLATYTPELYSDMIQNINDLRAGVTPATPYFWNLVEIDGQLCYECVSWPLGENFSYTNSQLLTAGTDGLPLGDLNWFPTAKATYLANRDAELAKIKNMAGPIVEYTVVGEAEAETSTLSGGASEYVPAGQTYFRMSAGYLKWVFDIPTAGQYDLNVLVDLNNRGTSGVNFFVNDFEIHDTRGWGQYVFGNDDASVHPEFPLTGLNWWLITEADIAAAEQASNPLDLVAGSNSIEIRASWCDNLFGGIDILEAGTSNIVKSLKASDITEFSLASPGIVGAPWTPSGFKAASLGTNGSVALSFDVAEAGDYTVQIFYQNVGSDQSIQVQADGANVTSVSLAANTDSSGQSTLSDAFPLAVGAHTITLTGSDVNIDYVQLVQKRTISSVKNRPGLPEGFNLAQNYPNPFNPTTNIDFDLGNQASVSLTIYNILGEKVATLLNNTEMNAGRYTYQFDARNLATGVYFYSLEAGEYKIQKKMLLLK